jgi:hypothetical protein
MPKLACLSLALTGSCRWRHLAAPIAVNECKQIKHNSRAIAIRAVELTAQVLVHGTTWLGYLTDSHLCHSPAPTAVGSVWYEYSHSLVLRGVGLLG